MSFVILKQQKTFFLLLIISLFYVYNYFPLRLIYLKNSEYVHRYFSTTYLHP